VDGSHLSHHGEERSVGQTFSPVGLEPVCPPCLTESPLGPAARRLLVASSSCRSERSGPGPRVPPGPPPIFPGLHVFSPLDKWTLAFVQARVGPRWGANRDSDPSRSARLQQKCRRSNGSPRRLRRRRQALPEAAGSSPPVEVRGEPGATVKDASRTSEADGPDPGHLRGGELGGDGRPHERSDGERTGPDRSVTSADDREGIPAPDAGGRSQSADKDAVRGGERR